LFQQNDFDAPEFQGSRGGEMSIRRRDSGEREGVQGRVFDGGGGQMAILLSIAICGAMGCLSRYFVSGWVYGVLGRSFPYGTFVVNIAGSFIIGFLMEFGIRSTLIPPNIRIGLTVGFMGGLTTFSTFSYETFRLLEDGEFFIASTNILLSVLTCLLFTWAGINAARYL
jgi:CrcB protein